MTPQPQHTRKFWITETQLMALRQGHTHVSAFDKKNILMTVWDDQMCSSHSSASHSSAGAQQRIEQAIEVLCKVDNRIGDLHYKATKDGSNMIATGLQQARNVIDNEIALLQAGDQHE